jgi:hypothetical protein
MVPFSTTTATLEGTVIASETANSPAAAPLRIIYPTKTKQKPYQNQLCMCLLQPLQPHGIIQQLARDAKYEQAIQASQRLSEEERSLVTKVLEECRQKLWEQTGDLPWLKQITTDSYIIQQAFGLFATPTEGDGEGHTAENTGDEIARNEHLMRLVDLDKCREICALALERVRKIGWLRSLLLAKKATTSRKGCYALSCVWAPIYSCVKP